MMTTNSTGDRLYFCNCEHEPWRCPKRVDGRSKMYLESESNAYTIDNKLVYYLCIY